VMKTFLLFIRVSIETSSPFVLPYGGVVRPDKTGKDGPRWPVLIKP
jgi:hypothetical protein